MGQIVAVKLREILLELKAVTALASEMTEPPEKMSARNAKTQDMAATHGTIP
jgi:hypothetical protein